MGRIKTKLVKARAQEFMQKYPEAATKDFKKNKEALGELATIPSKKIRNAMAGYLVRLAKVEN